MNEKGQIVEIKNKMPGNNYLVFTNLRPPVCIDDEDGVPLKSKNAKRSFKVTKGGLSTDPKTLKKLLVQNLTDDGHLQDLKWDLRHHIHPSRYNTKNSTYYKEYFDKPYRLPQNIAIMPKRIIDPYVQNELTGTRMPAYSKVAAERDIFGELGWIPNFDVKQSKDNDKRYSACREFFDAPLDYTTEGVSQLNTT